jgi:hypothetical protein
MGLNRTDSSIPNFLLLQGTLSDRADCCYNKPGNTPDKTRT